LLHNGIRVNGRPSQYEKIANVPLQRQLSLLNTDVICKSVTPRAGLKTGREHVRAIEHRSSVKKRLKPRFFDI
jgi:hypothetical protein